MKFKIALSFFVVGFVGGLFCSDGIGTGATTSSGRTSGGTKRPRADSESSLPGEPATDEAEKLVVLSIKIPPALATAPGGTPGVRGRTLSDGGSVTRNGTQDVKRRLPKLFVSTMQPEPTTAKGTPGPLSITETSGMPPIRHDMHRLYEYYPDHPLVIKAKGLEIKEPYILPEATDVGDLTGLITPLLLHVGIAIPEGCTFNKSVGGEHNRGVYTVSHGEIPIKVLKVHCPSRTNIHSYRNLHGVSAWYAGTKAMHEEYSMLPKLCVDKAFGSFEDEGHNVFHFSVMDVAKGKRVSEILKSGTEKEEAVRALGEALGFFHACHATNLKSYLDKKDKIGEHFETINHGDLNLDNIFIDSAGNITFVDLEAMFKSIVEKTLNLVDLIKLEKQVGAFFPSGKEILFTAYQEGLEETWKIYQRLNPAVPPVASAPTGDDS